ncbi:MAG TPA: TIR domain-containing protein [Lacunisphaera sp.]|nr:TIR domain-containing protein [Lacunisphaera sp.]
MSDISKAVFLSYAHEDIASARRVADALRAFGIEVWFDQNELRGGDAWDAKIRTQIRSCALCVPVISATTQARGEGYFRREWKIAAERTHDMASGVPFLLPVIIDDTPQEEAMVPEEFQRVQWTHLPQGVPTPGFVEQVKHLLEGPRKPSLKVEHRKPTSAPPGHGPVAAGVGDPGVASARPAAKKGPPVWALAGLAAVLIGGGVAIFSSRKPEPPPPATTPDPKSQTSDPKPAPTAPAMVTLPALKADKSVAVLPFTNMSDDKDSAFFTDGMHEDILTNLALIRELRVVSRTSVMQYRGTTKSMKQIAQELGVTYILEGSVRRSGNKVRVTGQLIHAATDEHVWAKSYDRDLTDIFTIQSELSSQIAGALKAALSPEEKALLARKPTENAAAYDLFLRARDILNREGNTPASRGRQIALLQNAVELDPNFAQAWGELAASCAYWTFLSYDDMDAHLARAKAAIDNAVRLAPDDPEVYGSLGTYYYYGFRDYARAVEQYEKRARLQPNSPVVFNSLGLIQRRQGQWTQSLANTRRACELDPANISYQRNLLATLRAARRWDEALAAQRRIVTLLPNDLQEAYLLAYGHFLATGSTREGDAFLAQLSQEQANSPEGISIRQGWAGTIGNFAEVVRLDKLQPYYEGDGAPHYEQAYFAAISYYALGDKAGARSRLEDFPAELRARLGREPKSVRLWAFLAGMEAILEHKDEALRCAERTVELLPESRDALDGVSYAAFRAFTYDVVGEKDKALAEYARLLRTPATSFVNVHEWKRGYSTLHGDPRYEALLADPKNNAPLF